MKANYTLLILFAGVVATILVTKWRLVFRITVFVLVLILVFGLLIVGYDLATFDGAGDASVARGHLLAG